MYVNSLACVKVKKGESEYFKLDSGVRQGCIISPWVLNVYMKAVMEEVKMGMGRMGVRFVEDERDCILYCLLYADDLVLCGKAKEDRKVIMECFVELGRRRSLKVNTDKSKVMVLGGEEGLEIRVDGARLEQVLEFKYFGCVLDESGIDGAEYRRKR